MDKGPSLQGTPHPGAKIRYAFGVTALFEYPRQNQGCQALRDKLWGFSGIAAGLHPRAVPGAEALRPCILRGRPDARRGDDWARAVKRPEPEEGSGPYVPINLASNMPRTFPHSGCARTLKV